MLSWTYRTVTLRAALISRSRPHSDARVSRNVFASRPPIVQQLASAVTVSDVECCSNPKVATLKRFRLSEGPSSVKQDLAHVPFHFDEDGKAAGVARIFTFPKSTENFLEKIFFFGSELYDDDEYVKALRQFLLLFLLRSHILDRRARERDIEKSDGPEGPEEDIEEWMCLTNGKRKPQRSKDDIGTLVLLRKQGQSLTQTKKLGMPQASDKRALQKLGSHPCEIITKIAQMQEKEEEEENEHGKRLDGSSDALFNSRLNSVWRALLRSRMTQAWAELIKKRTNAEWLLRISNGIPPAVKSLLAKRQCPTFADLQALPLIETNNAGVYARLMESRCEASTAVNRLVYIGSASKYGNGLNGRIAEQTQKRKGRSASRLQRDSEQMDLRWPGRFVTLMTMEMTSSEPEHILDVRTTVVIAEAVLTIWLGALKSTPFGLRAVFPWDGKDYAGLSSHNPLEMDIVRPRVIPQQLESRETEAVQ